MQAIVRQHPTAHTPVSLAAQLAGTPGRVLLCSASPATTGGRYSYVTAAPFLTFQSFGAQGIIEANGAVVRQHGDPWRLLDRLVARYELLDEIDLPFPLGGVFGFWGYDLRSFVEPRLPRRTTGCLAWPDCHLGFYDSLVVFDHHLGRTWVVSTGLAESGTRSEAAAELALRRWTSALDRAPAPDEIESAIGAEGARAGARPRAEEPTGSDPIPLAGAPSGPSASLDRAAFVSRVEQAQRYIRAGDIYQVNLARRLSVPTSADGLTLFRALLATSPMPYAAWLDAGAFQIASASPELFLRMSGAEILTRPIKGTRPRHALPDRDIQLAFELQTSPKEMAELVMITDLLRNDLGRVCEYGSIQVPELARLERYSYVQHLVSTVAGRMRANVSHLEALAACFPGGSVTGAPKIRAMEIIDELEPVGRGPYTGCLGYLGFNRESQLSIVIRTALWADGKVHFHTGAGIVADSDPEAEFEETVDKARGFLAACSATQSVRRPVAVARFRP